MSRELCKMRDEGLLLFRKNTFTLLGDSGYGIQSGVAPYGEKPSES